MNMELNYEHKILFEFILLEKKHSLKKHTQK